MWTSNQKYIIIYLWYGDKMNNKGFTLVELIVVIGILSLIFGVFSINFIRELDRSKEIQRETVKNQVVEAAKAYVELHKNSKEDKYNGIKTVLYNSSTTPTNICVSDLIEDGLINTTIVDLNSLEEGSTSYKNATVKFYYSNEDGTFKFDYEATTTCS